MIFLLQSKGDLMLSALLKSSKSVCWGAQFNNKETMFKYGKRKAG